MWPVTDLFLKQQEAQKCEKSERKLGRNNEGSLQSKQVGCGPACPSFQPTASQIRHRAAVKEKGIDRACQADTGARIMANIHVSWL